MTIIKEYNFDDMTIEEIADITNQIKVLHAIADKQLEKAKAVIKTRYEEKEIAKLSTGTTGEIEIREADDFHDVDAVAAYNAMADAGFADEFPTVCTVQLNNSGKKAKVQRKGISHFLSQAVIDKLRVKKRKKALTVYIRAKKD